MASRHLRGSNAPVRGRFAPFALGLSLLGVAVFALAFAGYAALLREPTAGFLVAALVSGLSGAWLLRRGERSALPNRREAALAVALLWLAVPLAWAVPYGVGGGFGVIDAAFESMSGFTTTGATVLGDFGSFPRSLFMWRALSAWLGGVGIIVLFVAVLPTFAAAGRQLFLAEAPGTAQERPRPRLRGTALAVLLVYGGLSALCALAYYVAGMSPFDALAHAFSTLSTGGFGTDGRSFEAFGSPVLEGLATLFMALAGTNFALLYLALAGRPRRLLRDAELRAYLAVIAVGAGLLAFTLVGRYGAPDAVRYALFQTVSILTTNGFASADFALWPRPAQAVLIGLMFVGGCAGSAAGGIKVARWLVVAGHTAGEVRRAGHAHALTPLTVGGQAVPTEVLHATVAFVTLYLGLFAATTLALVLLGADFLTALTASISCLGNVGAGLGEVGPMANFAGLHPAGRALLTFVMYAGRLELLTVLILLDPGAWGLLRRGLFARR